MKNGINWKKSVFILTIMLVIIIFSCIFLVHRKDKQWTTHINHLEWGMGQKEVQMFYTFADNGGEVSPHIFNYDLKESQEIFGCEMNITLIFEEDYGLIGIIGYTDEVERLEKNIQDNLGKYRTGSQPSNGISWKSEIVEDQYEKEQITKRYIELFGENDVTQIVLTSLMKRPLVSCELKTSGNLRGRLFIDANTLVKVQKLLSE